MPMCAYNEYKGMIGYTTMNTFMDDAKLIYGYNNAQETFVDDLSMYQNANSFINKELPSIFKVRQMGYNIDNKVFLYYTGRCELFLSTDEGLCWASEELRGLPKQI